ncbi:MAG: GTP cyclohydrolase I FolE2 [Thermoleophilia bacterium]|nr:GTP cyclohydrolase I FolE2 [Thermoleophilia bacterium]
MTRIGLSRVGVSRSSKAIRMAFGDGEHYMDADVDCVVDLDPSLKGVHMSRVEEEINEAIDHVIIGEALAIEALAESIARRVVDRQGALRGTATIRARYPLERRTPVTDVATQEMYGLIGTATATTGSSRRAVGVSAQGINACPCAQGLVREQAEAALAADGFTDDEIRRIVARVPIATHNQRARGTLIVGAPGHVHLPAEDLIAIVEEGMSSEIYELLKRPDELYVVDRAHRRPRFVEDSVREMVAGVVARFPDLPDSAFLSAHQENYETIHTHDVEAERYGLLGEMRAEIVGGVYAAQHITLAEWLGSSDRR